MNCCAFYRGLLGCAEEDGPCLGWQGTCGQLLEQFADYPLSLVPGYDPDTTPPTIKGAVCSEFPDPLVPRDRVITGLITVRGAQAGENAQHAWWVQREGTGREAFCGLRC